MSDSKASKARKNAEAAFKSEDASTTAAAELTAEQVARDDKTARLRALRLAKQAADEESAAHAPRRKK